MKSTGLMLTAAALPMLGILFVYPIIHNRVVHPLGRLAVSISIGDNCDAVRERLSEYISVDSSPAAQQNEMLTSRDLLGRPGVDSSLVLFVYDESYFDDLQLSIRCDSQSRRVVEKHYLAD